MSSLNVYININVTSKTKSDKPSFFGLTIHLLHVCRSAADQSQTQLGHDRIMAAVWLSNFTIWEFIFVFNSFAFIFTDGIIATIDSRVTLVFQQDPKKISDLQEYEADFSETVGFMVENHQTEPWMFPSEAETSSNFLWKTEAAAAGMESLWEQSECGSGWWWWWSEIHREQVGVGIWSQNSPGFYHEDTKLFWKCSRRNRRCSSTISMWRTSHFKL